jgi:hypothetical protein
MGGVLISAPQKFLEKSVRSGAAYARVLAD